MKNNKAAGPADIIIEMIKYRGTDILHLLETLFNIFLDSEKIPKSWKEANVILIRQRIEKLQPNIVDISPQQIVYQSFD